ncbi:MAG: DUF2628 domain-containing protein [Clostridia bacterium]|nr:DUF2628 domain-containing protein [Clostridia bacterium]
MNYTGQVCSGCGKLMSENEDIVVCPVCGTPQHRECWEENGECVNAARHAEKFVWQAEEAQSEPEKESPASEGQSAEVQCCVACGGENSKNALTCIHCGAPLLGGSQAQNPFGPFFNVASATNPFLYGVALDPDSEIEGAKVKDIACYVQTASSRYIPKFKDLSEKKKKVSFNWAALFFGPYWFFYRKMWKVGLIFVGILLAVELAFTGIAQDFQDLYYSYLEMDPKVVASEQIVSAFDEVVDAMLKVLPMFAIQGVLGIVAGFLADPIYKRHVIKDVKNLRQQFSENRAYEAASLKRGGTAIFIAFAAYFGYNVIYNLLLSLAALLIN